MRLAPIIVAAAAALALASPAIAVTTVYTATLSGPNESPPNTSLATGSALVSLDDVALSVAVHVTFADLAASATAGHIHCCTSVAGTGTVGVFLGFTGFPAATTGTYDNSFTLSGSSFSTLLAGIDAGKAYVNLHNSVYPDGEIRGFLAPVPEPETYALMLVGLAVVGAATRRRSMRR